MKENNTFLSSIKIWWNELFNMFIFLCISFVILGIALFLLGKETIGLYINYIYLFIIALSYIGIFLGANNVFKKIKKNKLYLSRKVKYIVGFFELIIFLGYGYLCFKNKLNSYLFIGGYIMIFYQFFINYIFAQINNKKFPKRYKEDNKTKNQPINSNEFIIDINKLK